MSVDSDNKYAFSFIYENIVGTFMCYVTFEKETEKISIQTFLRIGNGPVSEENPALSMIDPNPLLISLSLEKG